MKIECLVVTDVLLAANNSFAVDSKYPTTFATDIAAARVDLNVATASAHLPQERLSEFVEIAMGIRQIEERRKTIVDRVTRLEALARGPGAAGDKQTIQYVVLVSLGHPYGILAPLTQPISSADLRSLKLPKELTAEDPTTRMRVEVPTYQGGSITKPAGILVIPKSVQAMRSREAPDPTAELLADITRALNDLWAGGASRPLLARVNEFVDAPAR